MQVQNAQLWVNDQDEALDFYVGKLGWEVRSDVTMPELGGFRWLTVSPPSQPDFAVVLMAIPGPPVMDPETADQVRSLMAKGFAGTVFLVLNHSEQSSADNFCPKNDCPLSKQGTIDSDENSAKSDATLAWVGYGVGAVGVLAGGALLWAGMRSSSGAQPAGATIVPIVGPRMTGLKVTF